MCKFSVLRLHTSHRAILNFKHVFVMFISCTRDDEIEIVMELHGMELHQITPMRAKNVGLDVVGTSKLHTPTDSSLHTYTCLCNNTITK